jgi:hypothetical protein
MLVVGDDYAVNVNRYARPARYARPVRATYLGDAPYKFGGSNPAKLHSMRKEDTDQADGARFYRSNGDGTSTYLSGTAEVLVGDTMWLITPNVTGWQVSPYGGRGIRGLFALKDEDGEVERIVIVAYGVNIVSPWDVEEKRLAEQDARREQAMRDAEFDRDWRMALVHETIRVCDERGYSDEQIKDVLDESRTIVIEHADRGWSMPRTVDRARAFLIGAGSLEPTGQAVSA